MIHYEETQYGFEYGPAKVSRVFSHKGAVKMEIITDRGSIDVYVTPTGFIRVWHRNKDGSFKPETRCETRQE